MKTLQKKKSAERLQWEKQHIALSLSHTLFIYLFVGENLFLRFTTRLAPQIKDC